MHCLGHFPPISHLLHLPHTPHCFQAEHVLPLYVILLKRRQKQERKKNIKEKDKVFLLVEIRIAIQRDS
jgi:hypothetical protein